MAHVTEMGKQMWAVWALADDKSTYGENAGKTIITTADGDDEICSIIPREEAQKIVAAHNASVAAMHGLKMHFYLDSAAHGRISTHPTYDYAKAELDKLIAQGEDPADLAISAKYRANCECDKVCAPRPEKAPIP